MSNKHKVAKHFDFVITETAFSPALKTGEIAVEAATDGIYVVRNNLPDTALDDAATVRSYKSLALVKRAFRCIKTVDLQVRPVHHWLAERVRAHVVLCMLAYYLEWHMRRRLAPMLFDDTDKDAAEARRACIVAPAQRSPVAFSKQTKSLTEDGLAVHSFRLLLADLATLARNTVIAAITPNYPLVVITRPTPLQQKALQLLAVGCSRQHRWRRADSSANSNPRASSKKESRLRKPSRPPPLFPKGATGAEGWGRRLGRCRSRRLSPAYPKPHPRQQPALARSIPSSALAIAISPDFSKG